MLVKFKDFTIEMSYPIDEILKKFIVLFNTFRHECESLFRLYNRGRTIFQDCKIKTTIAVNEVMKINIFTNKKEQTLQIISDQLAILDSVNEEVNKAKEAKTDFKIEKFFKQ